MQRYLLVRLNSSPSTSLAVHRPLQGRRLSDSPSTFLQPSPVVLELIEAPTRLQIGIAPVNGLIFASFKGAMAYLVPPGSTPPGEEAPLISYFYAGCFSGLVASFALLFSARQAHYRRI